MAEPLQCQLNLLDRVEAKAGNNQAGTSQATHQSGIGHRQYRRSIDDDQVIHLTELIQQRLEVGVHQQLGGVRRNLPTTNKVQPFNACLVDNIRQSMGMGQKVRQARFGIMVDKLVQIALAHIPIKQHYLLTGLGNDGSKVGRNEGLANPRAGAGDHQDVVLRFHHGEMQAGTQAAQGFNGQVRRVGSSQQTGPLYALAFALQHFLILAEGDGRIHRQADLLNQLRVFDTAVQGMAQQGNGYTQHAAQQGSEDHNQCFLRFDRLAGIDCSLVNHPHVAHGAGAHDIQLLGLVQHLGVDLGTHLHITGQSQQLLLGLGKAAYVLEHTVAAAFQLAELTHQRLIAGVVTGKAPLQFFALEGQLRDGRFDLHHLIQNGLGLDGDIDRASAGLVSVECVFRLLKVPAYLGQLVGQKLKALLGFGGFALHILAHIQAADFIQYTRGEGRVAMLQSDVKNAGILALFTGADGALQTENGAQTSAFDQFKVSTGARYKLGNLNLESVLVDSIAYLAGHQHIAVLVIQRKVAVLACSQCQGLAEIAVRHFQLENIQPLAISGIAGKAQKRAGYGLFSTGLEAPVHEGADHREQLGFGHDGQFEVVHCLADDLAGFQQLDLGDRSRSGSEQLTVAKQAANPGGLLFDLNYGIGRIDRRGQQCVSNTDNGEENSAGDNDALVINQGTKQRQQVNFIVLVGGRRRRGVLHSLALYLY